MTTSPFMIKLFFSSLLLLSAVGVNASNLLGATRGDISLDRFNYTLEGDLVRAVDDYRTAVNQTGIEPSRERQILAETDRLQQLLKSRGYYHAQVVSEFNEAKNKPAYDIQLGFRYRIAQVVLEGDVQPIDEQWQSLKPGQFLSAAAVLAQQNKLKQSIEQQNCFFNVAVNHEVKLDKPSQQANVGFRIQASEPAQFETPTFTGIEGVKESFLRRVTGIRGNDCYQRTMIDSAVIALFDTGLFSQVRPRSELLSNGRVQVEFSVQQRKKRTIGASLGFQSEQGLGVKTRWQHRDLFGAAQSLSLQAEVQSFSQRLSAELVIPSLADRRNRLIWQNQLQRINTDFEAISWSSTATLERKASSDDYFEYGIGYSQTNENPDGIWRRYQQIRVPLQYKFDSVRNPLNPKSGWRFLSLIEPVFDIRDDYTPFVKSGFGLQLFNQVDSQVTLASRLRWDSLWFGGELGSDQSNIPEIERYSAGGSSTIRGYGYQSIKLADSDSGGMQRWLVINELRMRLNDSWGLVGFWDVGRIASNLEPTVENPWFTGYGLGVRYYTRFAPIRLDVALPRDKRNDDASFLIYLSLGQAF